MLSTSQVVEALLVEVYLNAIRTFPPTNEEISMFPEFVQTKEAVLVSNVADKFVQVAAFGFPVV
jgi:hypothetical protein